MNLSCLNFINIYHEIVMIFHAFILITYILTHFFNYSLSITINFFIILLLIITITVTIDNYYIYNIVFSNCFNFITIFSFNFNIFYISAFVIFVDFFNF
mmetsp:Transcript_18493/g.1628  ORF Transcript_18493/g.1628 Transcript_18493/m.1628 type:complete len:99 (+) Transcript_18493:129-425(+)